MPPKFLSGLTTNIPAQVSALGGRGRGGGTRKLAEARARVSGKSVKTEQRAIQRAIKSGKAPAKQRADVANAGANAARAQQVRASSGLTLPKRMTVVYDGAEVGDRDIAKLVNSLPLTARESIADLIEQGDEDSAAEALNMAIMQQYFNTRDEPPIMLAGSELDKIRFT